jgi:predicted phosphate transport protein (TIGR00153 family)
MLSRLFPKNFDFFALFAASAEMIVEAARTFQLMVQHWERDGMQANVEVAKTIRELEQRADDNTHKTMTLLHKTFITPIDRQDIHDLIKRLDDIMDFLDAATSRIVMYEIAQPSEELRKFAKINYESTLLVQAAILGLHNLANPEELLRLCIEINRLENEADIVLQKAMVRLFKEESDPILIIKLKEIYELMETVSDRCEDVANVVETIVLEYT